MTEAQAKRGVELFKMRETLQRYLSQASDRIRSDYYLGLYTADATSREIVIIAIQAALASVNAKLKSEGFEG